MPLMGKKTFQVFLLFLACTAVFSFTACREEPTIIQVTVEAPTRVRILPTATASELVELPTLYPTRTSTPPPDPTHVRTPLPTEIPSTPVLFEETVVEVSYEIPILNLQRTLVGNVSSMLQVTDETSGETAIKRNQTGVLFDLQQALPELDLEDVPNGCQNCVRLSYSLPMEGLEDSGWLTDVRMLASIENYTAANLGPHFPDDTIVALRRSATPYRAAQSLALTSDGSLWRWNAVDDRITNPVSDQVINTEIINALGEIELDDVEDAYSAACQDGAGLESFFLTDGTSSKSIDFICPELSLPANLMPLYLAMHSLLSDIQVDGSPEEPYKEVLLDSLLFYRRSDGSWMNLLSDGQVAFTDPSGVTFTSSISPTLISELTESLQESGILETGTDVFSGEPLPNVLFVRGTKTVFSTGWLTDTLPFDREVVLSVYELLDQFQNEVPLDGEP